MPHGDPGLARSASAGRFRPLRFCPLAAVLSGVPIVSHWDALRRPLRSCAIGSVIPLAFLSAWQFLIPGGTSNPVMAWAFILVGTVCLSSGVGLAISATRKLWRSTQRGRSVLPIVFLVGVVVGLPRLASAAGAHWLLPESLLMGLVLSALFSAYLIITARDRPATPIPPASIDADNLDAYVSDIPRGRKTG